MTPQQLKNSILQQAIEGKLTKQNENDELASKDYEEVQKVKRHYIQSGLIKKEKIESYVKKDEHGYFQVINNQKVYLKEKIPFEIPSNWVWVYIKDVAFTTKLAGFEYTKYIANNLVAKGIPLFKGKNVQHGKLIMNFESFIPEKVSDSLPRSQLNKRCLLTPYVGTIGNIAIFDGNFKAHLGSNVGKIELLNGEKKHLLEEYFLYYLQSEAGRTQLMKYKKATAQESISIDAIREVLVPLPPFTEQQRIVAKIEELQPYIDQYEQAYNRLESFNKKFPDDMKKSILQMAIEGKLVEQRPEEGSGEELCQQIQKEKQKLIKEGKISNIKSALITENEIPFEIPESWRWIRLSEIARVINGRAYKQSELLKSGKTKVLRVGNLFTNNQWYYSDLNLDKDKYCDNGDLIYAWSASFGPFIWNGGKVIYHYHIWKIEYAPEIDRDYFYDFLLAATETIKESGHGVAMVHVTKQYMEKLLIPLPPLAEQKRIVAKIEELLPLCDQLKQTDQ